MQQFLHHKTADFCSVTHCKPERLICDATSQTVVRVVKHCPAPAASEESSANLIMSTGRTTEVSSSAEQELAYGLNILCPLYTQKCCERSV